MKILFYSYKDFEKSYLDAANTKQYNSSATAERLLPSTVEKAKGYDVVSVFTGDDVSAPVMELLHQNNIRYVTTRAAGYDNIDIVRAKELGIRVANVPEYSPYAIAEHAVALILTLNRKLIIADKQVHQLNFTVGKLVGFDLNGRTVGIVGTGKIGGIFAKIMHGFGCRLIGYDIYENKKLVSDYGLEYMSLDELCRQSDIISIHTGFSPQTKYMINKRTIGLMKKQVMLINTGRGGCINTEDVIQSLENGDIGYFGADVYEKEKGIFFYDWSGKKIDDGILSKLLALPNVLITPHQAFATSDALSNIATTTFYNIECWANNKPSPNELLPNE